MIFKIYLNTMVMALYNTRALTNLQWYCISVKNNASNNKKMEVGYRRYHSQRLANWVYSIYCIVTAIPYWE